MRDAQAMVRHTSVALTASIRQAANWLGHASAEAASPALLRQVRVETFRPLFMDPCKLHAACDHSQQV